MDADSPSPSGYWPGLVPVAGCASFAASTLSIYFRDLGSQVTCAGSIVCGDFRADPRVLAAGVGFALLALALLLGTVSVVRESSRRTRRGPSLALLMTMGVAASFALLIGILTLSSAGSAWYEVSASAIWSFLAIGYLALWTALTLPTSLVGAWRVPARGLAFVHGGVSIAATLITVMAAFTPRAFL